MVVGLVTPEQIETLDAVAARLDAKGLVDESRLLREVLVQVTHGRRELRAAAAAEILAVTPQTIRNWIRGGVLPGRQDETRHFYVPLDALEPAIRLREVLRDQPAGPVADEEIDAEIEAVRRERKERRDHQARIAGGR